MLSELKNIADRFDDIEEGHLRSAGYQLLSRQFLHRRKQLQRKHYEVVVRFSRYFINLLDALNYNLVIEESLGYVGAIPRDFTRRMRIDETLLLLALRKMYDDSVNNFNANDDSTVDITLDDFELNYQQFTGRDLPRTKNDFDALREPFERCGIVELGEDEGQPEIKRLRIYPTITSLINGDALKIMETYLKAHDVDTSEQEEEETEA